MANDNPRARLAELRDRWDSDRSSRLFLQLAEEYRRLGQPEEALEVLSEGLKSHPATGAVQVVLGRCQLETGEHDAAVETLEQVVRRDPTQMVAYRALVEAYLQQRNAGKARERLGLYAQLNPQDPEIEELSQRIDRLDLALEPDSESEPSNEVPPPAEESSDVTSPPLEVAEPEPSAEETPMTPSGAFDPGATVQVPTPTPADLAPPSAADSETTSPPEPPDLPSFLEPPTAPETLADDLIARAGDEASEFAAEADIVETPEAPSLPPVPSAEDLFRPKGQEPGATAEDSFASGDEGTDEERLIEEPAEDLEETPVVTAPVPVADLPDAPQVASSRESEPEGETELEEAVAPPLSLPDVIAAQAASLSASRPVVDSQESPEVDEPEVDEPDVDEPEEAPPAVESEAAEQEAVAEVATPHLDLSEPVVDDVEPVGLDESDAEPQAADVPSLVAAPDERPEADAAEPADESEAVALDASSDALDEAPVAHENEAFAADAVSTDAVSTDAGATDLDVTDLDATDLDEAEIDEGPPEPLSLAPEDSLASEGVDAEVSDESVASDSEDSASDEARGGLAAAAGFVGSLGLGWVGARDAEGDSEESEAVSEEVASPTEAADHEPSSPSIEEPPVEQVQASGEVEGAEEAGLEPDETVQLAEPTNGIIFQLDASRLPPLANLELIPPRPLRRPRALQAPPAPEPVEAAAEVIPEVELLETPADSEPLAEPESADLESAVVADAQQEPVEGDSDWPTAAGIGGTAGATATLANLYREQGHTEEAARVMSSLRESETVDALTAADLLDEGADGVGLSVRKSAMLRNYLARLKGEQDVP